MCYGSIIVHRLTSVFVHITVLIQFYLHLNLPLHVLKRLQFSLKKTGLIIFRKQFNNVYLLVINHTACTSRCTCTPSVWISSQVVLFHFKRERTSDFFNSFYLPFYGCIERVQPFSRKNGKKRFCFVNVFNRNECGEPFILRCPVTGERVDGIII